MTDAVTDDRFLGGRLVIRQPAPGYRAGIDPVLLAAAVPAAPGQSVLDLGCGVGTAALCLAARVPGIAAAGVELQSAYACLARHNAAANGLAFDVATSDIAALPAALRARAFDHVIANPPYYDPADRTAARDGGREAALSGASIALWCGTGVRRLAPGGTLTLILDAAGLADLLAALADLPVGGIEIQPVAPRAGRPASRALVRARKSSRARTRLLAPAILHSGDRHGADGDGYSPAIARVLSDAAAFPWGGC